MPLLTKKPLALGRPPIALPFLINRTSWEPHIGHRNRVSNREGGMLPALPEQRSISSNGQCEQPNHPDYEDCECYGIIVKPMLPLCVHD